MSDGSEPYGVEVWQTVQVTALPLGWRNVYQADDGSTWEAPCPALLLQEHRRTRFKDQATGRAGEDRVERPPYNTRVVFSDADTWLGLEAASDATNYLDTYFSADEPMPSNKSIPTSTERPGVEGTTTTEKGTGQ